MEQEPDEEWYVDDLPSFSLLIFDEFWRNKNSFALN